MRALRLLFAFVICYSYKSILFGMEDCVPQIAHAAAVKHTQVFLEAHWVSVGEIRFYLQEKRAVFQDKELPFTKSEYEICEFLALHRGQVFTRERIFEHVFGFDRESDESAITEHIKNIRAKLKAAGASPIETVWGTGYKWIV